MLYFHAGLHKTGSTAIQNSLLKVTPRTHRGLRYFGRVKPPAHDVRIPADVVKRIRAAAHAHDLVVSGESLLGTMRTAYDDCLIAANGMGAAFGDLDFKILVYLRPQTEWVPSAYVQSIMEGDSDKPETFAETLLKRPYLSWSALVEGLSSAVGAQRLIVRPYTSTGIVEDFFATLGVAAPQASSSAYTNRSVPMAQVALLREMNAYPDMRISRTGRLNLQKHGWLVARGTETSVLPSGIQQELIDFTRRDYQSLPDAVRPTFASDPEAFSSVDVGDVAPYAGSELSEPLVQEQALALIRYLLDPGVGGGKQTSRLDRMLTGRPRRIASRLKSKLVR